MLPSPIHWLPGATSRSFSYSFFMPVMGRQGLCSKSPHSGTQDDGASLGRHGRGKRKRKCEVTHLLLKLPHRDNTCHSRFSRKVTRAAMLSSKEISSLPMCLEREEVWNTCNDLQALSTLLSCRSSQCLYRTIIPCSSLEAVGCSRQSSPDLLDWGTFLSQSTSRGECAPGSPLGTTALARARMGKLSEKL